MNSQPEHSQQQPEMPPPPPAAAPYEVESVPVATAYAVVPTDPTGLALPEGVTLTSPWLRLGCRLLDVFLLNVTLFIGWLIWAALIADSGQTPAKKLLSLRVIDADTLTPAGFGRMLGMRGLLGNLVALVLGPLTLGIIYLMPFWDKRNQTIWEKVSNTYVVDDPYNAWHR